MESCFLFITLLDMLLYFLTPEESQAGLDGSRPPEGYEACLAMLLVYIRN